MPELIEERLQYVRVTNKLPFTFEDRHDGVPVTIPPGKSESLPPDMAQHFFGYAPLPPDADDTARAAQRRVMLRHISKRHGWNTPDFVKVDPATGKTKAEEYFDKLEIKAIIYKMVPAEESDPQKPIPADPEPGRDDGHDPVTGRFTPSREPRMTPKRVEVNVT